MPSSVPTSVRLPRDLRKKLDAVARAEQRSTHAQIRWILALWLDQPEVKTRLAALGVKR